ncbi:hypothetical protein EVAR_79408_1 [Eumeta japonica]|uniref:Uncharacterized protein n=1 Tax=Eumeta variegata TaxID=151549 RepID=A0A4C1VIC8_EUMVA|nr:hypothetical protein EVAR_79408_1 [Eumeta japonica]
MGVEGSGSRNRPREGIKYIEIHNMPKHAFRLPPVRKQSVSAAAAVSELGRRNVLYAYYLLSWTHRKVPRSPGDPRNLLHLVDLVGGNRENFFGRLPSYIEAHRGAVRRTKCRQPDYLAQSRLIEMT